MERTYKKMKQKKEKRVLFSHMKHRAKYKCGVCHPKSSIMKKGTNGIDMAGINIGEWCGRCHNGNIAFDKSECKRCHNFSEDDEEEFRKLLKRNAPASLPAQTEEEDDEDDDEDEDEEEEENIFLQTVIIEPDNNIFINYKGEKGSIGKPGTRISFAAKMGALEKPDFLKDVKVDRFGLID